MGTTLLIIAAIMEVAFAIYCIRTRSHQSQVSSVVRVGTLGAFVLATSVSVIAWGVRWYGLAALLLVWAVFGALTLRRTGLPIMRSGQEKGYKAGRSVVMAVAMLSLVIVALLPALVFPEHGRIATTGEHAVATALSTFVDEHRVETYTDTGKKRTLNVEFWYPRDADEAAAHTYPLVVFSHGAFGIRSSNESLYHELASHGYVVAAIDHPYQALYATDVSGSTTWIDRGYMGEVLAENARADRQRSYAFYRQWMAIRTGDINFVLDYILADARNGNAGTVYNLVDPAKIGVMGHSIGGSAALGIGRLRADVSAVIALESPFMGDITGVENGEFVFSKAVYPVPVLNVYSDASWEHLCAWPQYAANCALLTGTVPTAFNVHITGVGHLGLTDLALTSPILTRLLDGQQSAAASIRCLTAINTVVLDFFDTYLKGVGSFTAAGTY
jgi:dienelactone hydrolase